MASTKEIKNHIKSVKDTQKITNAMYLIASNKMQRAKRELDRTMPYFHALQKEIKRIFRISENLESRYFYPPDGSRPLEGTYGCLVITADKGLAGAYNKNVIREAEQMLSDHPDTKLFVVGEYGRHYFDQHNIPIEHSFLYTAQNPTLARAREITDLVLEPYDRGEMKKFFIIYTDMKNSLTSQVISTRLLPFHRARFYSRQGEQSLDTTFDFFPSITAVLDHEVQSYLSGFIYSALVDSFCAEQNARMIAMDAANRNAEKLLEQLSLQYNRVRQAAITQELNEISSGARAQTQR